MDMVAVLSACQSTRRAQHGNYIALLCSGLSAGIGPDEFVEMSRAPTHVAPVVALVPRYHTSDGGASRGHCHCQPSAGLQRLVSSKVRPDYAVTAVLQILLDVNLVQITTARAYALAEIKSLAPAPAGVGRR